MPELLMLFSLESAINYLVVIAGIGLLIFVHELGHFLVAKWHKVRVEAFSLGFGPVLWGFRRGDTHYRLSLIPLGGYVKMAGETPGDEHTEDPAEFQNQSLLARASILIAGVVMNAIVAFLLFVVAFRIGVPLPTPVVGGVEAGSPAWKAGIRPGDRVERVNGTRILDFQDVMEEIAFADGPIDIDLLRDGAPIRLESVATRRNQGLGIQQIGLKPLVERNVDVEEGSPAWDAGIRPGDEVMKAAGVEWTDQVEFQRALAHAEGPVPFVVRRNGDLLTFEVTPKSEPLPGSSPILGISPVADLVAAVKPGSPAEAAGLRDDDVIVAVGGDPVPSVRAALDRAKALAPAPVTFTVKRDGADVVLAPVTGVASPAAWDSWFLDVVDFYSDAGTNRVSLMPDYQFPDGNPARGAGIPEGAEIVEVNATKTATFRDIQEAVSALAEDVPVSVSWIAPGARTPTGPVEILRRLPLYPSVGIKVGPATEKVKLDGIGESAAAGIRRSLVTGRGGEELHPLPLLPRDPLGEPRDPERPADPRAGRRTPDVHPDRGDPPEAPLGALHGDVPVGGVPAADAADGLRRRPGHRTAARLITGTSRRGGPARTPAAPGGCPGRRPVPARSPGSGRARIRTAPPDRAPRGRLPAVRPGRGRRRGCSG